MALGISEPRNGEYAPGTVTLSHRVSVETPSHVSGHTKHHRHDQGIVLVPQPSDSPNDPLNWPQWRKDLILLIISLQSAVVGAYGPMLGPGFVEISAELGVSVNEISQATSYLVLACGLGLFISNPLAKCYGKRPVYLVAGLVLFAASVWGAATEGYGSFLGSRLVGGLGMGPYEVLVQCTIGDMYFVHERATRIAFWNLFLVAGISAGPVVSAYIIQYSGYRWAFGVCAIFFGVLTVAFFFLAPETAFIRAGSEPVRTSTDTETTGGIQEKDTQGAEHVQDIERVEVENKGSRQPSANQSLPATVQVKDTYWRSLRVYHGRYSNAPTLKVMTRPFVLFLYPPILWAFLTWGTTITFTIAFGYVNGVIFTQEPYNMSTSQVGLTNLSPFVQSIIAEILSGPLCDGIAVRLTRRNNGTYEPEYRLALMPAGFILGVAGFYGFGATVHHKTHWTGPVLTYGMVNAGLAFVSTCVFGYIVDAFGPVAEEAFVAVNARNFLSFGILYFINAWLEKDGTLEVFVILGSLFVATSLLTVPLWIYGKRIRARAHRIEWLKAYMKDD
ncbi:major facilitator superfamily domain-containing protein [Aspergillus stella-maris]|uniref:major facilitator superfamily domain-containing protein n=1 Tax=Aspergillus stella-maris TaxID=1810926 RepID=UPI003CCC8FA3